MEQVLHFTLSLRHAAARSVSSLLRCCTSCRSFLDGSGRAECPRDMQDGSAAIWPYLARDELNGDRLGGGCMGRYCFEGSWLLVASAEAFCVSPVCAASTGAADRASLWGLAACVHEKNEWPVGVEGR